MRVLFWMSHAGFTRNFESTLRALATRGHEVEVALERAAPTGPGDSDSQLRDLERELSTLSVVSAPERSSNGWAETGRHLRAGLDYLRFLEPDYAPAAKPRRRAASHVPLALVRAAALPAAQPLLRRALSAAERGVPVELSTRAFLASRRPDVVCLTPLVDLGSPQTDVIRAARALPTPAALCVASWDNLTMRGGIHDAPDLVFVWNDRQRDEAVRLHGVPAERVVTVGAGAYDHWFSWRPGTERAEFCAGVSLDPGRPIVLYVGSSSFIAPDEAAFVREWAVELRSDAALDGVQLLVRPHPLNALSLDQRAGLEALGGVAVHPPAGANPIDTSSRQEYFDSIFHSAAVVGVNTSAFIEAAIVGRPIHTVVVSRYRGTQEGTLHFQHLLPHAGGALRAAATFSEHRRQLAESLAGGGGDGNRDFVASFVRPLGLDRPGGEELADALERLAGSNTRPRPRRPLAGRLLAHATRVALRGYIRTAR